MGLNSNVEWADHSLGFWYGCHKVSDGCLNCYAEQAMLQWGRDPHVVTRASDATFHAAKKWAPGRVFVNPWSDLFIEEADEWRDEAWETMRPEQALFDVPGHTYIIVTKRPHLIADRLPKDWGAGWPNVWLLVTVENQKAADERIPLLLDIPAVVRGVSIEPMLEEIVILRYLNGFEMVERIAIKPRTAIGLDGQPYTEPYPEREYDVEQCANLDLVIAGCESGPNRRPAQVDWFRSLRDQCAAAGVSYYMKQMEVGGRVVSLPELDGRRHCELPERGGR